MAGSDRGQGTVDMLLTVFLFTLSTFGTVHIGIYVVARHTANYAAFATVRAAMVHGSIRDQEALEAGRDVMSRLAMRGSRLDPPGPGMRHGRRGVVVPFHLPLATLLDGGNRPEGVVIEGFSPTVIQEPIAERGDNAQ